MNDAAMAPSNYASEAELLLAMRQGDERAFEALVRAHSGRLLAVARRLVDNEEDARDVVQEAFLSAFRGLRQFAGEACLATWLHRIAVNAALGKLRSKRRKPLRSIEEFLPRFLEDEHREVPVEEWRDAADALLERRETQDLVRGCIERLPESYRIVLVLRDLEELETEETAQMLGVTAGVVKTRLHRARQALRALLDPHFRAEAS